MTAIKDCSGGNNSPSQHSLRRAVSFLGLAESAFVMDNVQVVPVRTSSVAYYGFAEEASSESLARCRGLLRCLEDNPLEGLQEVTPAYCSLLLEFDDSHADLPVNSARVNELLKSAQAQPPGGGAFCMRFPCAMTDLTSKNLRDAIGFRFLMSSNCMLCLSTAYFS